MAQIAGGKKITRRPNFATSAASAAPPSPHAETPHASSRPDRACARSNHVDP